MNDNPVRIARAQGASPTQKGFSLVEVAVATAIVGMGIAAVLVSVESGTRVNDAGKKLTRAIFLAQEVREWTLKLPLSDPDPADANNPVGPDGTDPQDYVDDLDDLLGYTGTGVTYDPPRDGTGMTIYDLTNSGWTQTIDLTWRNPWNLSEIYPDGTTDVIYVEVSISIGGDEVLETGWIVTRKED